MLMETNHKRRRWLLPLLIVAGLILAGIIAFFALEVPQKLRAYADLKAFLEQPSFSAEVTLDARMDGTPFSAAGTLHKLPLEDKTVYALEAEGLTFGYHEGSIYLENGKAYGLGEHEPHTLSLPENALLFPLSINIERDGNEIWYQFQLSGEDAKALSPELIALSLVLETQERRIVSLHLSAAFSEDHISLLLRPVDSTGYALPEAMETAILSGVQPETEDLIDDILPLLSGFGSYFSKDTRETGITLSADCGPLVLSDSFTLLSGRIAGTDISRLQRKDLTMYLAEGKVFREDGRILMEGEANPFGTAAANPTQLLGLAYALCLSADYTLTQQADSVTYSFSLDEAGMKELCGVILPEASRLDIFFETGGLEITVENGILRQLSIVLTGKLDLILLEVPASISADLSFPPVPEELTVPEAVLDAIK